MDDAISLCNCNGSEFARGLSNYTSEDTERIIGKHNDAHAEILGYSGSEYLVHRDNIAMLPSR